MKLLRDAFETNGLNAFVWGLRGVGKTSLVHTACNKYSDTVRMAVAIACQAQSSYNDLMDDLVRRVVASGKVNISDKALKARLSGFGLTIEGQTNTIKDHVEIWTVNHASDLLETILPPDYSTGKEWVIILDEFDQLENAETIQFFTALAKQISGR